MPDRLLEILRLRSAHWPAYAALRMTGERRALSLRLSRRIESGDLRDHVFLLVFGQLGEDGQRHGLAGGALGFGEIAFAIAEILKALLLVQRQRVVDLGPDIALREVGA